MFDSSTRISPANKMIHFLHIGKCAGTAINGLIQVVNQEMGRQIITTHPHKIGLKDLPNNAKYFFSIRNPITRFYSGFYSRKRKGQPRLYVEWSKAEERAFTRFPEANDLAEQIFSEADTGRNAFSAMMAIRHVNRPQYSWFNDLDRVFENRMPLCILRQEYLAQDIIFLKKLLNYDGDLAFQASDIDSHRNDYSNATPLSARAIDNLNIWYAADLQFYRLANAWIKKYQT